MDGNSIFSIPFVIYSFGSGSWDAGYGQTRWRGVASLEWTCSYSGAFYYGRVSGLTEASPEMVSSRSDLLFQLRFGLMARARSIYG